MVQHEVTFTRQQLRIRGGVTVDVLDSASPHKRFECLLHLERCHDAKVDFHPQTASREFHASQWILTDRHASFASKLRYFDIDMIITPVVRFAAGHRAIFKNDFNNIASSKRGRPMSAHLVPQTCHDLGMQSCMTGMHGLHNLFNNIRRNVGPRIVW